MRVGEPLRLQRCVLPSMYISLASSSEALEQALGSGLLEVLVIEDVKGE